MLPAKTSQSKPSSKAFVFMEVLINCEKRINRLPSYKSSITSHKLPYNYNLRGNLLERSEEPLLNTPP